MPQEGDARFVLVTRKTRLDEMIARYNTISQARFYLERLGADFSDYQKEHTTYQKASEACHKALARQGRVTRIDRAFLPNYLFGPDEIIVVLGQDGLVANTLKYLNDQPLIGINPDATRWDGILLPFNPVDLPKILPEVIAGRRPEKRVTFAKADLTTGESLLAVNDFFIGPESHTSARYWISQRDRREFQSSSGIIISTGLGSTAWLKSVVTGAIAIAEGVTGTDIAEKTVTLPWDAPYLFYSVREPFPSVMSQTSMVFGKISASEPLTLESAMPEKGVIFSDGILHDYIPFPSGTKAEISVIPDRGRLIV